MLDGLAFDQFHHKVVVGIVHAGGIDLHQVGVPERGEDGGLSLEHVEKLCVSRHLGAQDLNGDGSLQADVFAAVDHAHGALTDAVSQLVHAAQGAGGKGVDSVCGCELGFAMAFQRHLIFAAAKGQGGCGAGQQPGKGLAIKDSQQDSISYWKQKAHYESMRADSAREEALAALAVADAERARALRNQVEAERQARIAIANEQTANEQRCLVEELIENLKQEKKELKMIIESQKKIIEELKEKNKMESIS